VNIKCNKCGYVGDESEFPTGRDFVQYTFWVAGCPKCDNRQSLGDAYAIPFGENRPFEYVLTEGPEDPIGQTLHRAKEAS